MQKKLVIANYAVEVFKIVLSVETNNSYLREVVFEFQIYPHTFSKAVVRRVK